MGARDHTVLQWRCVFDNARESGDEAGAVNLAEDSEIELDGGHEHPDAFDEEFKTNFAVSNGHSSFPAAAHAGGLSEGKSSGAGDTPVAVISESHDSSPPTDVDVDPTPWYAMISPPSAASAAALRRAEDLRVPAASFELDVCSNSE